MRKVVLGFLAILFFSTQVAFSANTVVGTVNEFNAAVSASNPGDFITLKNGTWTDAVLEFYADGTEGNPVTVRAETAGQVILTGTSRIEIYGKYLEVQGLDFKDGALSGDAVIEFRRSSSQLAENCRITNCRILNYNPSTDDIEYKWVSLFGKNNRVDHCTFTGKNHEGALLVVWLNGSANNHRIDHNYFSDIPELDRNGAETIRIGTSTNSMTESRTIVEYNVFEECDGELEIISNKSNFNIYRYNTFRNNNGVLTLRHGNDCEVYGNFFFGGAGKNSGGVRIIGERHKVYNNYFQDLDGQSTRAAISMMNGVPSSPLNRYFQVKNAEVVHNTIVNCRQAFAFGVGVNDELSLPPLDCTIANNVVDKEVRSDAIRYYDDPINVSYIDNFVNSTGLDVSDTGLKSIDPELTLIGGLWRVDGSQTAIDASNVSYAYVVKDMDGQQRDSKPDIGSDELSQDDEAISPLTANDVGSVWSRATASVNELHQMDINVYANKGVLYLSNLPKEHLPYAVALYTKSGQEVITDTISQISGSVAVPSLKGVYVLRVLGKNGVFYSQKVFVEE